MRSTRRLKARVAMSGRAQGRLMLLLGGLSGTLRLSLPSLNLPKLRHPGRILVTPRNSEPREEIIDVGDPRVAAMGENPNGPPLQYLICSSHPGDNIEVPEAGPIAVVQAQQILNTGSP